MAKDKLTEYSATNASNDVIGDISVAEGMLPSAVNNALREQMTHLKNFSDGTDGIDVLSLDDDDASASIKIQAPSAVTTTTTLTLPDGDGDAGAMLQTNGSGQLAWSTAYRNSNLITNSAMQVAQRGSSHTTEGYGSLDRYYLALSGASGVTMSQQAFSTADRNSLGFEKYLKLVVTTANHFCGVYQYIEASNAVGLIGKKATLSFYAKGTNPAGGSFTMQPAWYNRSSGGGDNAVAQSLTVTSSWVKYSFTFDIPAPANTTIDNSAYLSISFIQPSGDTSTTAWELNLAGLQFELGEQATPFEHRSYGEELAKCHRYYVESNWVGTQVVDANNTDRNLIPSPPQPMRTNPTITVFHPSTGTANQGYAFSSGATATISSIGGFNPNNIFQVGTGAYLQSDNTNRYTSFRMKMDAEL